MYLKEMKPYSHPVGVITRVDQTLKDNVQKNSVLNGLRANGEMFVTFNNQSIAIELFTIIMF